MRAHLVLQKAWSKADEEKLLTDCTAKVDAAAKEYLAMEPEPVADIFDYLHADLPKDLKAQREFAISHLSETSDE